jgi:hypothetical protein
MVGKLMNQTYKIQCNPIDAESLTQYDDYRKQLYANMYLAKMAPQMEEKTGIPLIPMGQKIPKNQDDAEMHMKLNYKMDASMAMEECVEWVDDQNMFPETRRKLLRDLITIKKAALYRYYDHNHNIIHEYVDPVDIITPYSKHDNYRNITYVAVHKQYQIWELAEMNPEFSNEDLYDIAMQQAGNNRNPRWTYGTSYEGYYQQNNADFAYVNFNVNVLEFHFIAENSDTRVKRKNAKGGFFFDKKPNGYKLDVKPSSIVVVSDGDSWKVKGEKLTVNKSKAKTASDAQKHFASVKTKRRNETSEIINNKKKYLYSGKWIPGTEYIWSYGMAENIPREKISGSYSPEVRLPISIIQPNMYDMQNKSLVERCIPFEDGMNLANLKFQQLLIKAVPPGVAFDVDALDGVITQQGETSDPEEILKMYLQTGSFPYSSTRPDGTPINGKAIETLPNGIGSDFNAYIATQQHYMQLMNDVIGFNSAVDASSPNADALVGVQKMAINATNNALRPLYDSHLNLILESTKQIMLMVQDSMQYNEKAFKMAIGDAATATLRHGKKIALNQFGIAVELAPDEEERAQIEGLIQLGIQNGSITASDAIRLRQELKSSAKLAAQLLVLLETKNKEEALNKAMQEQKQNAEVQMQSAQAAQQAASEGAIAIENAKIANMEKEFAMKNQLEQASHEREMTIQNLKNTGMREVAMINNQGKEEVAEISNEGKIDVENIKHKSKIGEAAFNQTIAYNTPVEKTETAKK